MIRVVLDTNVFVSALLSPQGAPARIFLTAIAGRDLQLCISGEIYAEYEEVIRRPRFLREPGEIEAALRTIRGAGL
jgi:putative PIN family toxin of toxin-antitoxin system